MLFKSKSKSHPVTAESTTSAPPEIKPESEKISHRPAVYVNLPRIVRDNGPATLEYLNNEIRKHKEKIASLENDRDELNSLLRSLNVSVPSAEGVL